MSSVIFVQRGISSHSDLVMFGNVSEGGRSLVRCSVESVKISLEASSESSPILLNKSIPILLDL